MDTIRQSLNQRPITRWKDENGPLIITPQHFMRIIGTSRTLKEIFSDKAFENQIRTLNEVMNKHTLTELYKRSKWHTSQGITDYEPGDIVFYYHQPREPRNKEWSLGRIISKEGRTSYNLLTSYNTEITRDARHLIDYLEIKLQ